MLSHLILPPGFSIRIDYEPEKAPMNATFTVFRDGRWVGELTVPVARLDHLDDLQDFADQFTKRGLRLARQQPDLSKEA